MCTGIAEWLDHLTLVGKVPGSKPSSDLSQSVRRELASSLLFQGKRQKESRGVVTSIGRTRVALLDYSTYSVGSLCLANRLIPYEDSKRICCQPV